MTTIQMKAKVDNEGFKKLQQLVQELRKHLNAAETLIGQINSATIQIELEGPNVVTTKGKRLA